MRNLSLAAPLAQADGAPPELPADSLDADFVRYCCQVLQQL